jgi:hypothetical protein
MAKMKTDTGPSTSLPSGPHASVSPEGYYELAKAWVRENGRLEGDVRMGFVAREDKTPAQWRAWLAYFAYLDDQTVPRGKKAPTFKSMRNGATVPTAWPLEFDLSAPPAPAWEFLEQQEKLPTPERRRELANMLRSLVANFTVKEARAPNWRDMTPKAAEARLAELAGKYASTPLSVNTREMADCLARARAEGESATNRSVETELSRPDLASQEFVVESERGG